MKMVWKAVGRRERFSQVRDKNISEVKDKH
jgi:hypothetical protein